MESAPILGSRTPWNLAAVGSSGLFRPTRLAWLGAPPVEAAGGALEQVHGDSGPSRGRHSPPAL